MAVKARKVTDETLAIFDRVVRQRPGTNVLELTEQLTPRSVYDAVNKVLEGIGGKWDKKLKGHVFAHDTPLSLADKLDGIAATGTFTSLRDLGFFPTPEWLANEMEAKVRVLEGMTVLEPSAGTGVLARTAAVQCGKGRVTCVEVQVPLQDKLRADGYNVIGGDFLKVQVPPDGFKFDRVLMNPPFARMDDVRHVRHAFAFLKPGGKLVAIMSPGWTFRTDRMSQEFRAFVEANGTWEPNPDGSFKESGTDVRTVMVTLTKSE